MKVLEQIEAKLKLLAYLQANESVSQDIVEAAKVRLGADLYEALSGEVPEVLREKFDSDLRRLEKGDLQPGDQVSWRFGNEPKLNRVVSVDGNSMKVNFKHGHNINTSEASAAPLVLAELRQLRAACDTARGLGGQLNIPPGFPGPGKEPTQYEVRDVES